MRTTILLLATLMFVLPAKAQKPLKVLVGADDDKAKEIVDHLKPRIRNTARYSLTDVPDAALTVDVSCLKAEELYVCHSGVAFFPTDLSPLHRELFDASGLVTCGTTNSEGCASSLFDMFVQGTQTEKLEEAEASLQKNVTRYIRTKQGKL